MKANIMKTQIFHKINYDLKGHMRSNKAFMFIFLVIKDQICIMKIHDTFI